MKLETMGGFVKLDKTTPGKFSSERKKVSTYFIIEFHEQPMVSSFIAKNIRETAKKKMMKLGHKKKKHGFRLKLFIAVGIA